jgi:hypothetical protein
MANIARFDPERNVWVKEIPGGQYYTLQKVAEILGVGGPSAYQAVKRGTLRAYRSPATGGIVVTHDDLIAYIQKRQAGPVTTSNGTKLSLQPLDLGAADAEDILSALEV